ncbi:MAG TPA: F0F1 ATP synthase subunit delta [Bacillota bacterium]|nr:F0F1 ATP synthase subunit delta [Bacillota bacterium]
MREAVVSKRYAEALFELGEENKLLDTFIEQFSLIKDRLTEHEQLFSILKHPQVQTDQKQKMVKEIFKDFHQYVVYTMLLLIERQRIELIPLIVDQLNELVNDAKGIAEATVYSVRPLTDEEQAVLAEKFAKQLNKKAVTFKNIVDPDVLGGLRIRIGHTIYDGTVRGRLRRLERNIATANK